MPDPEIPAEAPPSYIEATGSSHDASAPTSAHNTSATATNAGSHLNVPGASTSVDEAYRRSMEDEARPLPKGWVRTFDPESEHQFYVDTTAEPPRSIWHHPYDDDEYLATLPTEERERIEQESMSSYLGNAKHDPKMEDMIHAHSDIDDDDHQHAPSGSAAASSSAAAADLPPRPDGNSKGKGKDRSYARRLKDKVTGTTHEEREKQRADRAAAERRQAEEHRRIRAAMNKALQTGQPQLIGKDKEGHDLYISPPKQPQGGYAGYGGYGGGMYNPYATGMYAAPGLYSRPMYPYARPYGYGPYGYRRPGMGVPVGLGVGGGLLAGSLLGAAMF